MCIVFLISYDIISDGVAPRAKMNQQRSRRFRSAQDAQTREKMETLMRSRFKKMAKGYKLPPRKRARWDHNVITPGTPFMARLSRGIHYYICSRLNSDPGWKNVGLALCHIRNF